MCSGKFFQHCSEKAICFLDLSSHFTWHGWDPPPHLSSIPADIVLWQYPGSGTFESGGPCPKTHPVRLPQILLETVWDTKKFNNKADWPSDGSQPFVWSSGDSTGYSSHADYLFGWKDDSLQKHLDGHTYVTAPTLKTQSIALQNKCTVKDMVGEDYDSCKYACYVRCSAWHGGC